MNQPTNPPKKTNWLLIGGVGGGLVLVCSLFGCLCLGGLLLASQSPPSGRVAQSSILPTETAVTQPLSKPTMEEQITQPHLSGLGATRDVWEQRHTHQDPEISAPIWEGYDGLYDVWIVNERVHYIEQQWDAPINIETARIAFNDFLPPDAVLIETYSPTDRPEMTVDLYTSPTLAETFPAETWQFGQPGEFVLIQAYGRAIMAMDNNP